MTIQQWLFSFKGRIGRRDFWIWIGLWIVSMLVLFSLHDRGRSGAWALLMILAWMLLAGNWAILPSVWQWAVGRFVPTLILVGMLIDLGAFIGTQDANKYGKDTQDVKYRADS